MTTTDKEEKEFTVLNLLQEHGVSRVNAIIAISEMWNEQDLDELIAMPLEKLAEIAKDITDIMSE